MNILRKLHVLKYLMLAIGLLILAIAGYSYMSTQAFLAEAKSAQGKVLELLLTRSSSGSSPHRYTYRPLVGFETSSGQSVEFVSANGSYPAVYAVGEKVDVLYLPHNPHNAKINSFFALWGVATILGLVGLIFTLVGAVWLAYERYRDGVVHRLRHSGRLVNASIVDVSIDSGFHFNGQRPFRIMAQWQDPCSGQVFVYKSEHIWFDPTPFITTEEVTVWIDKTKSSVYQVDLSFLPKNKA